MRVKLQLYGLDDLSDPKDTQLARSIVKGLDDYDSLDVALTLTDSELHELRNQVDCLSAIFKQNIIIIRQLDRIAKLLAERSTEKLAEQ